MYRTKSTKGFTLIELLVVIAIIAILSTVVMAGLNSARQKGRDAKRLADVKNVQVALELQTDTCGGYPGTPSGAAAAVLSNTNGMILNTAASLNSTACATNFSTHMNRLPTNPTPAATGAADYRYCGAATTPTTGAPTCIVSAANAGTTASYGIFFGLEAASGSLPGGIIFATPSGVRP